MNQNPQTNKLKFRKIHLQNSKEQPADRKRALSNNTFQLFMADKQKQLIRMSSTSGQQFYQACSQTLKHMRENYEITRQNYSLSKQKKAQSKRLILLQQQNRMLKGKISQLQDQLRNKDQIISKNLKDLKLFQAKNQQFLQLQKMSSKNNYFFNPPQELIHEKDLLVKTPFEIMDQSLSLLVDNCTQIKHKHKYDSQLCRVIQSSKGWLQNVLMYFGTLEFLQTFLSLTDFWMFMKMFNRFSMILKCEHSRIWLIDADDRHFFTYDYLGKHLKASLYEGVFGQAIKSGILKSNEGKQSEQLYYDMSENDFIQESNYYISPLVHEGTIVGLVQISGREKDVNTQFTLIANQLCRISQTLYKVIRMNSLNKLANQVALRFTRFFFQARNIHTKLQFCLLFQQQTLGLIPSISVRLIFRQFDRLLFIASGKRDRFKNLEIKGLAGVCFKTKKNIYACIAQKNPEFDQDVDLQSKGILQIFYVRGQQLQCVLELSIASNLIVKQPISKQLLSPEQAGLKLQYFMVKERLLEVLKQFLDKQLT